MGTRRFFVRCRGTASPSRLLIALSSRRSTASPARLGLRAAWHELHDQLRALVAGKTVAMEVSPADAVPYLDRVPTALSSLSRGLARASCRPVH